MQKRIVLPLTGGLGNQLFQLAAALYFAGDAKVLIDTKMGRPRLNSSGLPEIFSLNLPQNVSIIPKNNPTNFQSKVFGYLLRMGLTSKLYEKIPGVRKLFSFLGTLILSVRFQTFCRIGVNTGVGFDKNLGKGKGLYIGYFQTFRYLISDSTFDSLFGLSPKVENALYSKYTQLAAKSSPLVVHYRLGDYKQEVDFGMPELLYYERAIQIQWESGNFDSIWVFSDEINEAKRLFPRTYLDHVEWIEGLDDEPSLTLELMRYGAGYVIANSTFSWWGASLSYSREAQIVAPEPWFRHAPEPIELIPQNWIRLPAWTH